MGWAVIISRQEKGENIPEEQLAVSISASGKER